MDSPDVEHGADSILKRLTLTFRSVNVHVTAPDAALGETLLSYADPRQLFGFLYNSSKPKRVSCLTPMPTHNPNLEQAILKDVTGQVKPSEMVSPALSSTLQTQTHPQKAPGPRPSRLRLHISPPRPQQRPRLL